MSKKSAARSSRGFGFVELAIAIVILSLGLIPIFSMMMNGTRQSAFSEYHFFATLRAQKLAEEVLTYSVRNFAVVEAAGSDLEEIAKAIAKQDAAFPKEYRARLAPGSYRESVAMRKLEDGFYMLDVTITWSFAAERPGLARTHSFTLHRALARPDTSFTEEIPLADQPASVS